MLNVDPNFKKYDAEDCMINPKILLIIDSVSFFEKEAALKLL